MPGALKKSQSSSDWLSFYQIPNAPDDESAMVPNKAEAIDKIAEMTTEITNPIIIFSTFYKLIQETFNQIIFK
jgi:hypothetical protein